MSVTDIWLAPTDAKPATEVSSGTTSWVVRVPRSDWTEVTYSAWVSKRSIVPPLLNTTGGAVPPVPDVPPPCVMPPRLEPAMPVP